MPKSKKAEPLADAAVKPVDHMAELETPAEILLRLVCPACGMVGASIVEIGVELRWSDDDSRVLVPVFRKKNVHASWSGP